MGEFERGVELSKRARQLNPLHSGWYHFSFARLHYNQRAYEKTISDIQQIGIAAFLLTHLLTAAPKGRSVMSRPGHRLAWIFKLKPNFSARAELQKWIRRRMTSSILSRACARRACASEMALRQTIYQ